MGFLSEGLNSYLLLAAQFLSNALILPFSKRENVHLSMLAEKDTGAGCAGKG